MTRLYRLSVRRMDRGSWQLQDVNVVAADVEEAITKVRQGDARFAHMVVDHVESIATVDVT